MRVSSLVREQLKHRMLCHT